MPDDEDRFERVWYMPLLTGLPEPVVDDQPGAARRMLDALIKSVEDDIERRRLRQAGWVDMGWTDDFRRAEINDWSVGVRAGGGRGVTSATVSFELPDDVPAPFRPGTVDADEDGQRGEAAGELDRRPSRGDGDGGPDCGV